MKNTSRLTLVAALGLATVTGAQAQDLLLGFNDAAGISTAQNDFVVNLGSLSQFTATTAGVVANGTYDASLFNSFNTAFGTDGNALNDVAVGVAGSGSGTLYQTAPNGGLPVWTSGNAGTWMLAASEAEAPNTGVYQSSGEFNRTGAYGWSEIIAASPTSPGNAEGGYLSGNSANPMGYLVGGVVTEQIYESTFNGQRGSTPSVWTDVGSLTVNLNTDTITYIGSAVPEPSVYGLLAGAGLLVVALRRPMTAKKS